MGRAGGAGSQSVPTRRPLTGTEAVVGLRKTVAVGSTMELLAGPTTGNCARSTQTVGAAANHTAGDVAIGIIGLRRVTDAFQLMIHCSLKVSTRCQTRSDLALSIANGLQVQLSRAL